MNEGNIKPLTLRAELLYKPQFKEVVRRHQDFFAGKMENQILVTIETTHTDVIHPCRPKYLGLDMEEMQKCWESSFRIRSQINDDYLPVAQPEYGTGVTGGFFGGDVKFTFGGQPTSWSESLLNDYSGIKKLHLDWNNSWIKRVTETTKHLKEMGKGKYLTGTMTTLGPFDFCVALRGSNVYLDLYDHPKEVKELLDFAVDFTIQFLDGQHKYIDKFEKGIFDAWGFWMPGKNIFLGEHALGLVKPELYAEFGLPYSQRLIDHFGGAWVQLHTYELQLTPQIAKLKKIFALQITDDENENIRGFDVIKMLKRETKGWPLLVSCRKEELEKGMRDKTLTGGVWYYLNDVPSIEEANRLVEKVRKYRWKE